MEKFIDKSSIGAESRERYYNKFIAEFVLYLRIIRCSEELILEFQTSLEASAKAFLEKGWTDESLGAIKEQYDSFISEIKKVVSERAVSEERRKEQIDHFDSIFNSFVRRLEREAWENEFSRELRAFEREKEVTEEGNGEGSGEESDVSAEPSKREERLPLGRRIANSIPDKYSRHFAIGILLLLILTFGFHFYNSFWGKRSKEREVESLKLELRQKDQDIDYLKKGGRHEALLDEVREAARSYDESALDTPQDTLLLEAYTKDVDPILPK